MKDSEQMILKAIFDWTWRRFLTLSIALSLVCTAVLGGLSLVTSTGKLWEVLVFFLFFGPFATTGAFLYCRFIKGPLTLARLRSKGRTEAVEFCLGLMGEKPNITSHGTQ